MLWRGGLGFGGGYFGPRLSPYTVPPKQREDSVPSVLRARPDNVETSRMGAVSTILA